MSLLLPLLLAAAQTAAGRPAQEPGAADAPAPARTPAPARLVVLDKEAATAEIVDVASGEVRARIPVGDGPHEVAIRPDGRYAVVADYGTRQPGRTLTVLDLVAEKAVGRIDLGAQVRPHGLAWESDGRHLWVTAEATGEVLRVDTQAGDGPAVVKRLDVGKGTAGHMIARKDDGYFLVSHIASGMITPVQAVTVFNVETGPDVSRPDWRAFEPVPSGKGAEGIAVRRGGREVWVTNRAEGTVAVFHYERGELVSEPVARLECPGFPIRVVFTPDGSKALVSCAEAGEVEVFDADNKVSLGRIAMPLPADAGPEASTDPIGITVSADGTKAYVSLSAADHVAELDLGAMQVLRTIPVGRVPDGIAWYRAPLRAAAPPPDTPQRR